MRPAFYGIILISLLSIIAAGCSPKTTGGKTFQKPNIDISGADIAEEGNHSLAIETGYNGALLAGSATTPFLDFNVEDYNRALQENKKIVLNFHANWCNICKAQQFHYFAAFNGLNDPDLVGFRVNFKDSETSNDEEELAKQFGISYQHTMVIIKGGKRVFKSPEALDKDQILGAIKKA